MYKKRNFFKLTILLILFFCKSSFPKSFRASFVLSNCAPVPAIVIKEGNYNCQFTSSSSIISKVILFDHITREKRDIPFSKESDEYSFDLNLCGKDNKAITFELNEIYSTGEERDLICIDIAEPKPKEKTKESSSFRTGVWSGWREIQARQAPENDGRTIDLKKQKATDSYYVTQHGVSYDRPELLRRLREVILKLESSKYYKKRKEPGKRQLERYKREIEEYQGVVPLSNILEDYYRKQYRFEPIESAVMGALSRLGCEESLLPSERERSKDVYRGEQRDFSEKGEGVPFNGRSGNRKHGSGQKREEGDFFTDRTQDNECEHEVTEQISFLPKGTIFIPTIQESIDFRDEISRAQALTKIMIVLKTINAKKYKINKFICGALIDWFHKNGFYSLAKEVFFLYEGTSNIDTVGINIMIQGAAANGDYPFARALFENNEAQMDITSVNIMIKAASDNNEHPFARALFEHNESKADTVTINTIIQSAAKEGDYEFAKMLLKRHREKANARTICIMMNAAYECGDYYFCKTLYENDDIPKVVINVNIMIKAASKYDHYEFAKYVFKHSPVELNMTSIDAMIGAAGKHKDYKYARKLFEKYKSQATMRTKCAIIKAAADNGFYPEAKSLFESFNKEINAFTLNAMLKIAADNNDYTYMEQVLDKHRALCDSATMSIMIQAQVNNENDSFGKKFFSENRELAESAAAIIMRLKVAAEKGDAKTVKTMFDERKGQLKGEEAAVFYNSYFEHVGIEEARSVFDSSVYEHSSPWKSDSKIDLHGMDKVSAKLYLEHYLKKIQDSNQEISIVVGRGRHLKSFAKGDDVHKVKAGVLEFLTEHAIKHEEDEENPGRIIVFPF